MAVVQARDPQLLVSLLIGTNNLGHGHPPEATGQGVIAVARRLLTVTRGKLLINALLPRGVAAWPHSAWPHSPRPQPPTRLHTAPEARPPPSACSGPPLGHERRAKLSPLGCRGEAAGGAPGPAQSHRHRLHTAFAHLCYPGDGPSLLPKLCPPRCDRAGQPYKSFAPPVRKVNALLAAAMPDLDRDFPGRVGQHGQAAVLAVPRLLTPAAWDARLGP